MANDMQVAQTILAQLGGNRFIAMTGAKSLVADADRLQFRIGAGAANKINCVVIKLEPTDLYTVEFWKIRGCNTNKIESVEMVGAESLRAVFESKTGFVTSL
jgi:hypothetical protein